MARDQRRLAAIVSADVAGYSRLMGKDDSRTLAALKEHRRALIDPKISEHGGRIVKTTGDGLLLEFPSVVDAVRCAVDVQRGMAERNVGVPSDEQLQFRVGINLGDIIIDGDDIHGDGVNVAARLQALAEPGEICVSKVVRDQVLDKLGFTFDELGEHRVKNIARPVEVYRVDLGTEVRGRRYGHWKRRALASRSWVALSVVVLGVVVSVLWALPGLWKTPAPKRAPHFSVAILPFVAPGGGLADEQFADALTSEITATVGPASLTVAARSLTETYKGKTIDPTSVGRDLSVRYLIQGDVRRAGERLVITTQLVHAASATQVWSDRLEIDRAQAGPGAREPGALISRRARSALFDDEYRRASAPLPAGADAMDIALHANAVYDQTQCDGDDCLKVMVETQKEYERALRLDPNLVYALNGEASLIDNQLHLDLRADRERLIRKLDDVTNQAVATDPNRAGAWGARAMALTWQGRWQAALEANARAGALSPNSSYTSAERAWIMLYMGRPEETLAWANKALADDPKSVDQYLMRYALTARCQGYMALGRYDEAIADCEKSEALYDYWDKHAYLAAAYAQKGEPAKAQTEKALLLKTRPGVTIAGLKRMGFSNEPAYLEQTENHLYAGLRKAGIPEE